MKAFGNEVGSKSFVVLVVMQLAAVGLAGEIPFGAGTCGGRAEWLRGSVGVSVHWTAAIPAADGSKVPFEEAVDRFDVKAFAGALAAVGARHLIFTTAHGLQYLPMPNAALDAIAPGRTTRRDLFGEILDACAERGIRVIAYYNHSCNSPEPDSWKRACACPFPAVDRDIRPFASNICSIVRCMSDRYGRRLAGWWFDSSYSVDSRGPHTYVDGVWHTVGRNPYAGPEVAFPWDELIAAARSGNPGAAVAINAGVGRTYQCSADADYYAGETAEFDDEPDGPLPAGLVDTRWTTLDDPNWTFSAKRGFLPLRRSPAELRTWTLGHLAVGRAVTFNVLIDRNGRLNPAVSALKDVFAPHRAGGFEYLKAVREVFTKCDNEPDYRLPKDVGLGPYDRGIDWSATKERKASGPPGWTPEGAFLRPPKVARPGVWWHWMGAQVTEEGIARDLDWFVRMGIASATVFGMADSCTPWAKRIGNIPTEGLRPFDERWWKLFAFACREGRRRGIDIGLHNCPGYTSTGGPWIPSRLAMRELVFDITNAAVQVSTKPNAIFPVYNEDAGRFELPPCLARQTDVVEIGVARGGVRVAHIPMGAFVQPADWDTFGLECDKMNPEAVDFHLDHVIGELKRHLGDDLPAAGLGHVLLDSYEAGTPTWTPRMREEFKSRRGYDPLEFLPILGGRTNLYTTVEIERFRRDFDRTLKDLYRDVLFRRMSERLRAEGVAFANEPYEGPFEPSEVAPYVDRIMTEFWYDPKGAAISKEHQAFNRLKNRFGNRHNVVEAEAFTGAPEKCAWTEMPANIKPSADDAFLGGVNRLILHTSPLQPWGDDVVPGVTMGRWGVHFGRTQTWAESGKAWFDYLARCQSLLQWGEPSDARLDVPFAQLARTDGVRTLWFLVNKSGKTATLGLSGRWYDPVSGEIGVPPRTLAAGQSGFYERDEKAESPTDAEAAEERPLLFDPAVGDRSKSPDPAVRYHSGTVRYRAVFDAAEAGASPVLDLRNGYEQVFAVRLNGKCVGTVWCAPWEIRLPAKDLRAKGNVLEIDVTNAWRNRLVGDEQEPADCEFAKAPFGPGAYLVRYPDWFAKGMGARPSAGRRCFVTWNGLDHASSLLPSGLVETPVLRVIIISKNL